MSNGSSKDKLVLYNPVTLKFWACRNWQFRKMQKKKKKKKERSYGSKMSKILLIIIPWLHYHSLSLKSESNKRIGNEASTMSRLSNRVWTKQQTDCTHRGHMVYRACRPDQSISKWNELFPEGFGWKTISFVHII